MVCDWSKLTTHLLVQICSSAITGHKAVQGIRSYDNSNVLYTDDRCHNPSGLQRVSELLQTLINLSIEAINFSINNVYAYLLGNNDFRNKFLFLNSVLNCR